MLAILRKDQFTPDCFCSLTCLVNDICTNSHSEGLQGCSSNGDDRACSKCGGKEKKAPTTQFTYFNQCDRWRTKYSEGEKHWQEMMDKKVKIDAELFLYLTDTEGLLDEDETVYDFVADDPDHGFYVSTANSKPVTFIAHAGFEFIFTEDGDAP